MTNDEWKNKRGYFHPIRRSSFFITRAEMPLKFLSVRTGFDAIFISWTAMIFFRIANAA